ncbi:MAG: hypothetical protein MRY78_16800 [Saprospiraceae bacterium]|nr:hypothetical protein [Saprospiraceae bacterium]
MTIHSIIGLLLNYAGGLNLDADIIQTIEKTDERISNLFKKECHSFFEKTNKKNDLEFSENNNGVVEIKSATICKEIIKTCKIDAFLKHDYLKLSEDIFAEVPFTKYYDRDELGNKQRLEFLKSALARHQVEGKLYFYNDYEKAILIHRILSRFAKDEDVIIMKSTFLTPFVISIEVTSEELGRY